VGGLRVRDFNLLPRDEIGLSARSLVAGIQQTNGAFLLGILNEKKEEIGNRGINYFYYGIAINGI